MKCCTYLLISFFICLSLFLKAQSQSDDLEALKKELKELNESEKEDLTAFSKKLKEAYRLSADNGDGIETLGTFLELLAATELKLQNYEAAISYYERGLKEYQAKVEVHYERIVHFLVEKARLEEILGLLDAADYSLKEAQQLAEQYEVSMESRVMLLSAQAGLCLNKGQYDLAAEVYDKALSLQKQHLGKDNEAYARLLNDLAVLYYQLGQTQQAAELLKESQQIRKKQLGVNDLNYAESTANLATVYSELGHYGAAENLFKEAIAIRKKQLGETHPRYVTTLRNLATLYNDLGYYDKAEGIYQESLEQTGKTFGKESQDYIYVLMNLASLYNDMGRYEEASLQIKEALPLATVVVGEQHPFYAHLLSILAYYYMQSGEEVRAEEYYLEAIASLEQMGQTKSRTYFTIKKSWGALLEQTGRYNEALRTFTSLRAQVEPGQAEWLLHSQKIIEVLFLKADYPAVLAAAQEILPQTAIIHGEQSRSYISSLCLLASAYYKTGQETIAWATLQKAAKLCTDLSFDKEVSPDWVNQVKAADMFDTRLSVRVYKTAYEWLGEKENPASRARRYRLSKLLVDLCESLRTEYHTKEDKLRTLESSGTWVTEVVAHLDIPNKAEAFLLADEHKAVLLMEELRSESSYAFGGIPDSLKQTEQLLLEKRNETKALLQESPDELQQKKLLGKMNKLNREFAALQELLTEKYPRYAAFKRMDYSLKVEDLQAQLPEGTALVEYVISDEQLHFFYIDANGIEVFERQVALDSLRQKVRALRKIMSGADYLKMDPKEGFRHFSKVSHWFYKELLAPALKGNSGINRLIIIPDGELAHLPFEVFLVEAAATESADYRELHYLLEDYSLSYNYSAKLWLENRNQKVKTSNSDMLALAAHYDKEDASTFQAQRLPAYRSLRKYLSPLPEARKEVIMLSERFNGQFVTDSSATEHFFKQEVGNYGIVHLAMHGLLDVQRPLLSSLAFTEDGDSTENNFLQAYEISRLNINASLVVLSACETGFGKYEKGNGTASLARSFMYAGVPALVVSLWQVNDASTSKLMQLFYKGISDGLSKDEALRKAKLSLIKNSKNPMEAHPALWAPFIQMGDSRPIELSKKGDMLAQWPWLLGGAGVLLAGFVVMRRRKEG